MIYPCDVDEAKPVISPSGKYVLCFYFNGCFRKVVVDDRLPSSNTSRSLHVIDRISPNFLWPALVEKAYLKVRGGYDFPGSNSGTDLWVLTGWIPEQVFLHREDTTGDQLWMRLFQAFHHGDVLLTVGTGQLTEKEQAGLGLVSEHDYAILDMEETRGRRNVLVKNPWAGTDTEPSVGSMTADQHTATLPPGRFWMDFTRIFQNFENLYLNWNPELFRHREDIHFSWDLSSKRSNAGCFVMNPQFALSTEAGGIVWLLLGKHFRTSEQADLMNQSEESGFVSLYVFKADGKGVCLSDGALHRGPYVDSPNVLVKLEMPPRSTYTVVVSEQSLPPVNQNFTLSALSTHPATLAPAKEKYSFVTKTAGAWTPSTAGGNAESPQYSVNPQFSLETSELTNVSILLETPEPGLAAHVKLFWSNGKRVTRVRSRDIAVDSGDYRQGCAFAETTGLGRGAYTIVCSTFAPYQLGHFTLWVSATSACEVKPLAPESAGRRIALSDVGILPPGKDRMLAPLRVPRLTRIKLIARSRLSVIVGGRAVAPSPMLMTVELGQGPYKEILASSEDGAHADAAAGIRVEDFDLLPGLEGRGGIWVVVERIGGPGGQVEDHVEVEALAEERVEIGEWSVED